MIELQNKDLLLQINSEAGSFSLIPVDFNFPIIFDARIRAHVFTEKESSVELLDGWKECQVTDASQSNEQGNVKAVCFSIPSKYPDIRYELTMGVTESHPMIIWKMKIVNESNSPIKIGSVSLLSFDFDSNDRTRIKYSQAEDSSDLGFYYNGWQSWSPAGWIPATAKVPYSHLGPFQHPMIYQDDEKNDLKGNCLASTFFGAVGDRKARTGFVLGSLSQKKNFTSIWAIRGFYSFISLRLNFDLVRIDPGCSFETDWAVFTPIRLDDPDPMHEYFEAVARENHVRVPDESPAGWCSWYHFYTNLSAQNIRDNLNTIVDGQDRLPIQLVQIDDGFESQVGDWFSFKTSFKDGVKPLAEEIKAKGLVPGLWLAPFTVHPKSELIKHHPDWILRNFWDRPVNAGLGWDSFFTGLDLTVPEALDYACEVVRVASKDWGFPYLKLDFLYCAALPGYSKDRTKTRAQILRMGMEAIREAVGPDVTLLGCGAPIGSVIGLVDAMRIGPDVSGDWKPKFGGIGLFFKNEPSMPCAYNSIRNILTRANQHKYWWINDPDCLLVRPDTHLSLAEVQSLATAIAVTGGSLLVSDDLPKLPAERLRIAEVLLPVIGERARVVDWFDAEMPAKVRLDQTNASGEWHVLAKFNWADKTADVSIDPAEYGLASEEYWVTDFWSETVTRIGKDGKFTAKAIKAHGCVLAAFRKVDGENPVYLGSNLHFSMGREVSAWKVTGNKVSFTLNLPRKTTGKVWVHIPWQKFTVEVGGAVIENLNRKGSLVEIPVTMDGTVKIEIDKK